MIKNVVFDIGNVLVTFHTVAYFNEYFQDIDKTERLCQQVFGHEAWNMYDQGIYQLDDLKCIYKEAYPQDQSDITYMLDHWLPLMNFMPETFAYLKKLKERGFKIYLLSNISKDSADYLKKTMPFFDEVKEGILSYEVNINKPDQRIYDCLLTTYHLKPEETIFLDDNSSNVKQALRMGIHGIQFINIDDALEKVENLIRSKEHA